MSGVTLFFMVLAMSVPAAWADLESEAVGSEGPGRIPSAIEVQPPAVLIPTQAGSRGRMLYENHCLECHESMLFIREKRTVGSFPELRAAVLRWAAETKLPWGTEEIDDVTGHLNRTYYHFGSR